MQIASLITKEIDTELYVRLSKKGDKQAFERLIQNNKASMYRIALSILGNKEDIEDAIQNTIVKSYIEIINLKKDEYFKTWFTRILLNECNSILKKNKRTIPISDFKENTYFVETFDNLELTSAVNSLEYDLRIITTLFYFEDMPQKEIAKLLNIPEGTVRSRLSRARNKLYQILKDA